MKLAQTVASSAEQLSASIQEIARQVSQSNDTSKQAVNSADVTSKRVQGLAEAANRIGDVVGLISDIAEQTNLLALNATIEAARAGDAGKGFAVVASEVKSLAEQTGKATEEIGQHIGSMQSATTEAVNAIQEILNSLTGPERVRVARDSVLPRMGRATANRSCRSITGSVCPSRPACHPGNTGGGPELTRFRRAEIRVLMNGRRRSCEQDLHFQRASEPGEPRKQPHMMSD